MKELFTYFYKCRMCGKRHSYYGEDSPVDDMVDKLERSTNPGALAGGELPDIPPRTTVHVCVDGKKYGVADLIGMVKESI